MRNIILKNCLLLSLLFPFSSMSAVINGTTGPAFAAILKNPSFNATSPAREFLSQLLEPLAESKLPFPTKNLLNSINFSGPFVAPNWQLSTIHRLPWSGVGGPNQFFFESQFSQEPFSVGGIGTMLFVLGHPLLRDLQLKGIPFVNAINQVPLSERPDLTLIRNDEGMKEFLPVASSLSLNEQVYVIHAPFLEWLSPADREMMRAKGTFVSAGKVIEITGNVARIDVFASQGSSGGTILNAKGEVIGVLTASARPAGKPPMAFMMILDAQKRSLIKRAMQLR